MARYVAGKPGHRKEWRAWVSGKELTVRFGKIGGAQQEKTKELASPEAAKKELDKLIKKKLAEGYEDWSWHEEFDSGLRLREADLPLPVPPTCDSEDGAWRETFWHEAPDPHRDAHVFALSKKGNVYRAGIIDRGGGFRMVEPAIEGPSFPYGFDDARDRFIVATPKGAAFVVDCKTARAEEVAAAGAEILSVALGRDYFAVLRKGSLELTVSGKKLDIPCGREDKLFGFGSGLGLMLTWEQNDALYDGKTWPSTFFLGIDKTVRLLGQFGLSHDYGYDLDGRSFFRNSTQGLIEITGLDAALAKTAGAKPPAKLV